MKLQGRLLIEFIQAVHLDLFFQVCKSSSSTNQEKNTDFHIYRLYTKKYILRTV